MPMTVFRCSCSSATLKFCAGREGVDFVVVHVAFAVVGHAEAAVFAVEVKDDDGCFVADEVYHEEFGEVGFAAAFLARYDV